MTDNSSTSPSLVFGMFFCQSISVQQCRGKLLLKSSLCCCNNLTAHFNQFFCVSELTDRFQSLYQINRNDLNNGNCVKTDDNARNIYIRTG